MKHAKKDVDIVDELVEAARDSGWQDDQGTGSKIDLARSAQDEARESVLRRITRLRAEIRKLKKTASDEKGYRSRGTTGGIA